MSSREYCLERFKEAERRTETHDATSIGPGTPGEASANAAAAWEEAADCYERGDLTKALFWELEAKRHEAREADRLTQ